jgi:hypothetical protein
LGVPFDGFRQLEDKRLWYIGGDYRKVSFDDQLCHSSKIATILDLVHRLEHKCLGRLMQFFCDLLGVIRRRFLSMINSSKMATTAAIMDLVSIDFLTNSWVNWSYFLVGHWG